MLDLVAVLGLVGFWTTAGVVFVLWASLLLLVGFGIFVVFRFYDRATAGVVFGLRVGFVLGMRLGLGVAFRFW